MLVIIHGWSDTSKSFERLGQALVDEGVVSGVAHVRLGDYVSLDDDVTFDDVTEALERAWVKEGLPRGARSCDVLVHSTGGLVVRHWMTTKYSATTNPIRRFVMLAPANFGSHLAHKGRSFIGRVVKGYKSDRAFHTGAQILDGLELASPFTWGLAERDRFGSEEWYGPGRVLGTVIVGSAGYSGISAIANEEGSDGTVRVSTAHVDAVKVTLDFTVDPQKPKYSFEKAKGRTAFVRVPGVNHGTITLKTKEKTNATVVGLIRRGLKVDDAGFDAHCDAFEAMSVHARASEASEKPGFQNTVVRLTDQYGAGVEDFFFEMFAKREAGGGSASAVDAKATAMVQQRVMRKVHTYKGDGSYRSILMNADVVEAEFAHKSRSLYISVTAMPDVARTGTVGYSTFGYNDIGSIKLDAKHLRQVFGPDRTALVDMRIRREQTDKVFRFSALP